MSNMNVAVLGAGVIGLTTALELRKEFRNLTIDIITENVYDKTTSYVAAGIFRPSSGNFGITEEITRKWIYDSYNYWEEIRISEGDTAGVKEISGYIFSSEHPHIVKNKYLEKLVPIYRTVTEEELKICPGDWKYGCFFSTLLTDPTRYLRWALNKLQSSQINLRRRTIENFRELNSEYDIIVNCTGLGGKKLCNDSAIVALRGQVAKVEAPWVKNFFYGDYDTYIIPSFENVTLGGCRQYESYNMNVSKYDYLAIRERCEQLLPRLKDAKLIENKVGLRPHRVPVRVEKEYLDIGGKDMKIIHNYGHGGYGITTAPGTAINAVQLMRDILLQKKSKL